MWLAAFMSEQFFVVCLNSRKWKRNIFVSSPGTSWATISGTDFDEKAIMAQDGNGALVVLCSNKNCC